MNKAYKILFLGAGFGVIVAFIFSLLGLTKLGSIGDGDPLLSPLRIINRNIASVSFAVFLIIVYLLRKDK